MKSFWVIQLYWILPGFLCRSKNLMLKNDCKKTMSTDNSRSLVVYCDELKQLIREEVRKFREELTLHMGEEKKDKHLDSKPLNIQQVADRYGKSKATIHNWMKQ